MRWVVMGSLPDFGTYRSNQCGGSLQRPRCLDLCNVAALIVRSLPKALVAFEGIPDRGRIELTAVGAIVVPPVRESGCGSRQTLLRLVQEDPTVVVHDPILLPPDGDMIECFACL
jgi:hypothetical protein